MFVGILDQAFHLSDIEQDQAGMVVNHLLALIDVPDRGDPADLPVQLVWECRTGKYSRELAVTRNQVRTGRQADARDAVASVAAWREALLSLIVIAYPDLDPVERLGTAKRLTELLAALDVPSRAASALPEDVVRHSLEIDGP